MNIGAILLLLLWVMPTLARLEVDEVYLADILRSGILPAVEIVATVLGLVLIFKRAPAVRRFWLVYLSLFSAVTFWELISSYEPGIELLFLLAGLGWLAYWWWAPRARALPLDRFWSRPDGSAE
jgi:hypothetical protein